MDIKIVMKDWRYKEDDETKEGKICGQYVVRAGATDIATQSFNDGYGATAVPFSAELKVAVSQLTKSIVAEIQKHFTGKE